MIPRSKHMLEVAKVLWNFKEELKVKVVEKFKPSDQTITRNTCLIPSRSFAWRHAFNVNIQHNGVSERQNGFILEMTRCLLYEKNLL